MYVDCCDFVAGKQVVLHYQCHTLVTVSVRIFGQRMKSELKKKLKILRFFFHFIKECRFLEALECVAQLKLCHFFAQSDNKFDFSSI